MKNFATLADVAKAAGVSVGTASRVLNNLSDVRPDFRQKVLKAIARLQYEPLRRRTAMTATRAPSLGLIYLGMDDTLIHVPILTEVLHSIESSISQVKGNLLFANLPNADAVPAFLKGNEVEGLILKTSQYGALPDPEKFPLIRHLLRFPRVWMWAKPEGAPGDLCSFSQESVARVAVAHLQDCGHRAAAFINPKQGKSSHEHMKMEFAFACEQRDLAFMALESASPRVAAWPEPAVTSDEAFLPLIDRWIALPKAGRPTALFVPADNMAVHLYGALAQRGLQAGRDVSVISCNHEKSIVRALKPSLTTIDVGVERIGAWAVEQILWRRAHPQDKSYRTILSDATLVVGDSVVRI